MKYYSLNFVVAGDDDMEERIPNCLHAMEMVLETNQIVPELIMFTEVDGEWVAKVHAELDNADEEE